MARLTLNSTDAANQVWGRHSSSCMGRPALREALEVPLPLIISDRGPRRGNEARTSAGRHMSAVHMNGALHVNVALYMSVVLHMNAALHRNAFLHRNVVRPRSVVRRRSMCPHRSGVRHTSVVHHMSVVPLMSLAHDAKEARRACRRGGYLIAIRWIVARTAGAGREIMTEGLAGQVVAVEETGDAEGFRAEVGAHRRPQAHGTEEGEGEAEGRRVGEIEAVAEGLGGGAGGELVCILHWSLAVRQGWTHLLELARTGRIFQLWILM